MKTQSMIKEKEVPMRPPWERLIVADRRRNAGEVRPILRNSEPNYGGPTGTSAEEERRRNNK